MFRRSTLLLAASCLSLSAVAIVLAPPAAAQKKQDKATAPKLKLSKGFTTSFAAAQQAVEAGDAAAIRPALDAAKAAIENDDDRYAAGTLLIQAGGKLKDEAMQKEGLELALASPSTPADQRAQFGYFSGAMEYNAGNGAAAAQKLTAAYEAGYRQNDIEALIAEAYGKAGDTAQSAAWMDRAMAAKASAGTAIPESWLKRQAAVAYNAKNYPAALTAMTKLVEAYPTQSNWRDTLTIFRESRKLDNGDNLDLLRLMRTAGALRGQADYGEYVEMADARRQPGEVLAVLREGEAKGQLGSSSWLSEQRTLASQREAADKATLAASEKDARASADGKLALVTADAYLGYGDHAKAAELYDVAIQKGVAESERAELRRGIALALAGDKAGAQPMFAGVTGEPKQQIASYWQLYLNKGSTADAPAS